MHSQVNYVFEMDSPTKEGHKKKKRGSQSSKSNTSDDEYDLFKSRHPSPNASSDSEFSVVDLAELRGDDVFHALDDDAGPFVEPYTADEHSVLNKATGGERTQPSGQRYCGLCATYHGPLACPMTMDTISLAEFRKLIIYKSTEPYETRVRHLLKSMFRILSPFLH